MGNSIVAIPGELTSTILEVEEIFGEIMSLIGYRHCIHKAVPIK